MAVNPVTTPALPVAKGVPVSAANNMPPTIQTQGHAPIPLAMPFIETTLLWPQALNSTMYLPFSSKTYIDLLQGSSP